MKARISIRALRGLLDQHETGGPAMPVEQRAARVETRIGAG
ncbi:hypothetical protein [Rathayibacter sp. VKM Ac-2926]|nr:hypothetical protein [Rathayibacter sp. VKM Ac-2926]